MKSLSAPEIITHILNNGKYVVAALRLYSVQVTTQVAGLQVAGLHHNVYKIRQMDGVHSCPGFDKKGWSIQNI